MRDYLYCAEIIAAEMGDARQEGIAQLNHLTPYYACWLTRLLDQPYLPAKNVLLAVMPANGRMGHMNGIWNLEAFRQVQAKISEEEVRPIEDA